jgi:hypothetical protein
MEAGAEEERKTGKILKYDILTITAAFRTPL